MEVIDDGAGFFEVAGVGVGDGGGADIRPLGAERFDDRGQDEALDIFARRKMRAELVAFHRIQSADEQRAEDGGFDIAPVLARGIFEEAELQAVDGQNGVVGKQAAVKLQKFFPQDDGDAFPGAGIHFAEQGLHDLLKAFAVGGKRFEQFGEAVFGQQLHVLGEHTEQAAGEKLGDDFRLMPGLLQRFGEFGEMPRNFARDIGGMFRGIERGGIRPEEAETGADFFISEIGQPDAKGARVGKWEIGFARLREVAVKLERVADIHDDDEGRIVIGDGADIALGLPARLDHGIVPRVGAAHGLRGFFARQETGFLGGEFELRGLGLGFLKLFGFEDEAFLFVEINASVGGRVVGMFFDDGKLEKITGVRMIVGAWNCEQVAKLKQERLRVRPLGRAGG